MGTNINMDLFKLWLIYVIEYHVAIPVDDIWILVNQKKQKWQNPIIK